MELKNLKNTLYLLIS